MMTEPGKQTSPGIVLSVWLVTEVSRGKARARRQTLADRLILPQPGDVIAGKYRVDCAIGSGGMGAVYQVTHRVTGKRFAMKWLLPQASAHGEAAQRFIREAQVAGRFEHPNVV